MSPFFPLSPRLSSWYLNDGLCHWYPFIYSEHWQLWLCLYCLPQPQVIKFSRTRPPSPSHPHISHSSPELCYLQVKEQNSQIAICRSVGWFLRRPILKRQDSCVFIALKNLIIPMWGNLFCSGMFTSYLNIFFLKIYFCFYRIQSWSQPFSNECIIYWR